VSWLIADDEGDRGSREQEQEERDREQWASQEAWTWLQDPHWEWEQRGDFDLMGDTEQQEREERGLFDGEDDQDEDR
jgi:hypothetical protein